MSFGIGWKDVIEAAGKIAGGVLDGLAASKAAGEPCQDDQGRKQGCIEQPSHPTPGLRLRRRSWQSPDSR